MHRLIRSEEKYNQMIIKLALKGEKMDEIAEEKIIKLSKDAVQFKIVQKENEELQSKLEQYHSNTKTIKHTDV